MIMWRASNATIPGTNLEGAELSWNSSYWMVIGSGWLCHVMPNVNHQHWWWLIIGLATVRHFAVMTYEKKRDSVSSFHFSWMWDVIRQADLAAWVLTSSCAQVKTFWLKSGWTEGEFASYYVTGTSLWIQTLSEKVLNPPNHSPVPLPKKVLGSINLSRDWGNDPQ